LPVTLAIVALAIVALAIVVAAIVVAAIAALAIGPALAVRLRVRAGIEHPEIVFGVLIVGLGADAIAGRLGIPGHRQISLVDLVRVAPGAALGAAPFIGILPLRPAAVLLTIRPTARPPSVRSRFHEPLLLCDRLVPASSKRRRYRQARERNATDAI
jgi:hypothetical protein